MDAFKNHDKRGKRGRFLMFSFITDTGLKRK